MVLTSYASPLKFDDGHIVPMQTQAYYIPGPMGIPKAVLVITSTDGTYSGKFRWVSEVCPEPRPKYFTQDFNSNKLTRVRECLIVNSSFATFAFFKPDAEVLKAAAEKGLKIFKSGYSLRSVYGAESSTLLRLNLMTVKSFKGLATPPTSADLHEVPPKLVAMGEAIHNAVRNSVLSLNGELTLPPVEFDD